MVAYILMYIKNLIVKLQLYYSNIISSRLP